MGMLTMLFPASYHCGKTAHIDVLLCFCLPKLKTVNYHACTIFSPIVFNRGSASLQFRAGFK